jgi:hypothetical protein
VSVSGLERRARDGQTELFEADRRESRLTAALDRLRDKLGEATLVPAGSLTHRRSLGHVPFGAPSGRALGGRPDPGRRSG